MKSKHFFRSTRKFTAKCYLYMPTQLFLLILKKGMQVPVLELAFHHLLSVLNQKDNRRCNNADLFFRAVSVSAAPKMSNGWRFYI